MNKKTFLAGLLLAGSLFAKIDFSLGVNIGPPPPPMVYARPGAPGPGYAWVDGYWYPVNGRYVWREGFWRRPPHREDHWIAPRHDGSRWFEGYWTNDRDSKHRDYDRDRDRHR